jgi:hypothetical protein
MPTVNALQLAIAFAEEIQQTIGEHLDTVNARNVTPDYVHCCATHDFCDSNQCLIDALESLGVELDTQSNEQIELCNAAWNLCKSHEWSPESLKKIDLR